ncbi:MAG: hypothetical protein ABR577_12320 [Pyrinomonadaceae bacterium]
MLKHIPLFRKVLILSISLLLLVAALAGAGVWRSAAISEDQLFSSETHAFHNRIRDGVGRGVQFASPKDSSGNIRASVNSVAHFIFTRSGTQISGEMKSRLAAMEERTLSSTQRRLSVRELSDILSEVAMERLSKLTDQEIAHVDDNLRGFNAPDLPESYRRGREVMIRPRASRLQFMSSEKFIAQLKSLRDMSQNTIAGAVFRGMARNVVQTEVRDKARVLSAAVPEKFGGLWDGANDREGSVGLTPLQSLLVTYSVASDDYLCDSESYQRSYMKSKQQFSAQRNGHFPSPDGHFAYGVNGYFYSTPLDLIFDEQTANRLLDRIEERSTSQ